MTLSMKPYHLAVVAGLFISHAAVADDYVLTIKDHKFSPAELVVPANQKIQITVKNEDKTPEEFESHELNREKVIAGGSQAKIFIGPLKPGSYPYFGEFNPGTAKGIITAK
jgi:hypothetical protein